MATADDEVRYQIDIQASEALLNLKNLATEATTTAEKIAQLTAIAKKFQSESGMKSTEIVKSMKEVDQSLTGILDNKGWTEVQKNLGGVSQASEEVGNATERGVRRAVSGVNLLRIALGALVAMIIFNVIQAFQQMISMAITGLRELETATYNLVNAEKTLSEQGINIKPTDFTDMINQLLKLDPLLSKIQATELVSSLSTKLAPALGLNKKQIEELGQSIVVLAIRNKGLGKSFEEVQSQVENAFLSGRVSTGINQLGVKITDQIVKDEALRLGLVATAKEFDNLSGSMQANIKAQAMISLLSQNTGKDLAHLPDYFKTADAAFGIFQARLQDLFTSIGVKFGPVLQQIFIGLADVLTKILDYMNKNSDAINTFVAGIGLITRVAIGALNLFIQWNMWLGQVGAKISEILSKIPFVNAIIQKLFPNQSPVDTPTSGTSPFSNSSSDASKNQENIAKATQKAQDDIQKALQDSADKKLDIERDYQRKLYDINRDYNYKLEDIARKTEQKQEDALRSYNQKVEDINRSASESVSKAKQDSNDAQLKREQEFQQRLKELREKFLFDLEDALRERDARQVLRLIRQYNMDKANLEDKHKQDAQQAKRDLAQKLQDIERERQLKLQAAQREYNDKLAEIKLAEQRENEEAALDYQRKLEDARIAHDRQLEEQRQFLQRKLRDIAAALQQELKLSSTAAQALVNMFSALAGSSLSGLNALGSAATSTLNPTGSTLANPVANAGFTTYTGNPANNNSAYGYAEGGTLIATRPTKALFGENGPERVDITPLDHSGNNVGKMFGDKSSMGMGGSVKIALELSPDLEARIVENSLDGMAVTLEKVIRSK